MINKPDTTDLHNLRRWSLHPPIVDLGKYLLRFLYHYILKETGKQFFLLQFLPLYVSVSKLCVQIYNKKVSLHLNLILTSGS